MAMPIYEYECAACGEVFERLVLPGDEEQQTACPKCAAAGPRRRVSGFHRHAWSSFLDGMEKRVSPHKFK
jgi:putative FmdB family regulatory protein